MACDSALGYAGPESDATCTVGGGEFVWDTAPVSCEYSPKFHSEIDTTRKFRLMVFQYFHDCGVVSSKNCQKSFLSTQSEITFKETALLRVRSYNPTERESMLLKRCRSSGSPVIFQIIDSIFEGFFTKARQ